jgi:hypothetical protein
VNFLRPFFASVTAHLALPVLLVTTNVCRVPAADSLPGSKGFFAQKYSGQRNDFSGQVGFEFVPAAPLSVTALGRSVSGGALQRSHAVTLWDPSTEKPLARGMVSPASKIDEHGFAFELLPSPVVLETGRSYRLTSGEEKGGDPMIGKCIMDGDLVVLEHGMTPRNGDVVAALIDNESTLKTFLLNRGKPFLRAENPKYPDLIPAQELVIQGVMLALIRKRK